MTSPQKIIWAERDVGQKLSIVLGGLLFFGFTLFTLYAGIQAVREGDWLMALAPVGWLVMSIELLHRWRRRNAR